MKKLPLSHLVAFVLYIIFIFNGGGVNALYAQGAACPPLNNCMLICNPDFVPSESCNVDYQQEDPVFVNCPNEHYIINVFNITPCLNFGCWDNIYGTPDFSYTLPTPDPPADNFSIRCWAVASYITATQECCPKGEGIMTNVTIQQNKKYIASYLRRVRLNGCSPGGNGGVAPLGGDQCTNASFFNNNQATSLENLHLRLTNASEITWPTNLHTLLPEPSNYQVVSPTTPAPSETNVVWPNTNWRRVVRCFTASQDWNTLYLYPQQNNCSNGPVAVQFEQVELIEDTFMDITTSIKPSCLELNAGVCIGWDCEPMTDMVFSWQFSTNNGSTWNPLPNETPQISVSPAQTTIYRLCRTFAPPANNAYQLIGQDCADECIDITVEVSPAEPGGDINTLEEMYCCLLETPFTLSTDSPFATPYDPVQPNRIGFIAASGTWTANANPFVSLGLINQGDDILLDVDLVVPSGVTLVLGEDITIRFAPNRRLLVQANAELRLVGNQTLLTGLCNTVWQGIQVQGPGYNQPRQNNGGIKNYGICLTAGQYPTIQNAIIGIAGMEIPLMDINSLATSITTINSLFMPNNNNWMPTLRMVLLNNFTNSNLSLATAGGVVVILKRPIFDNCLVGINLSWFNNQKCLYPDTDPDMLPCDISLIATADFTSTALVFPFNTFPSFVPTTEAGVELVMYQNLTIGDNSYSANLNFFNNNRYAIRAIQSDGLHISGNNVQNCSAGISIGNGILNPWALGNIIAQNQFSACRIAIQCGFVHANIHHNKINETTPATPGDVGIFLMGSNFRVENNKPINAVQFGALLVSNDETPNLVRLNEFTNNRLCVGLYGNNTGTQVVCNDFEQYQAGALYAGPYIATDPNYPAQLGLMNDQGECTVLSPYPADNTFAGLTPPLWEILSFTAANFNYFYRPAAPYIPTDAFTENVTVTTIPCPGAVSIEENPICRQGRSERSDAEIIALPDEDSRNREAKITADYYLQEENNKEAALNLLAAINTNMGRQLLIPHYIQDQLYSQAQALIDALPDTEQEEVYHKQMCQMYKNMAQAEQNPLWLSPQDEANVRQIAQSYTKTSFAARNLLLLLYGEEYAIPLPNLDTLAQAVIAFKSGKPGAATGQLYPNPANQTLLYNATHLTAAHVLTISLYTPQGQLAKQHTAPGGATLQLATDTLPSGIYYCHIQVNGQAPQTQKIAIIR